MTGRPAASYEQGRTAWRAVLLFFPQRTDCLAAQKEKHPLLYPEVAGEQTPHKLLWVLSGGVGLAKPNQSEPVKRFLLAQEQREVSKLPTSPVGLMVLAEQFSFENMSVSRIRRSPKVQAAGGGTERASFPRAQEVCQLCPSR